MSFLSRLFTRSADPREALRPLWHRVVELAREQHWYAKGGIEDTVAGRFDAITLVLALVLLRMERDPALAQPSAFLTELFVEDMDGQLRESGVGDLVVGKHVGKLMSVLGGRLGTLRELLQERDDAALQAAVARNASFTDAGDPAAVVAELRKLAAELDGLPDATLLAGEIGQ